MLTLTSLGLLLLHFTLSNSQLLPIRNGRANLPVLQDPLFNSRPAEIILKSQFKAWGLDIDLDLDVDVDAQVNLLGLDLLARKDDEKRSLGKRDTAGLNLGLNLGTGVSDKLLDLNTGMGALEAGVAVHPGDWGKAEQAAKASKGPRGFSAVSVNPLLASEICSDLYSGIPISRLAIPLNQSLLFPTLDRPTSLSLTLPAQPADFKIIPHSTLTLLIGTLISHRIGLQSTTTVPQPQGTSARIP
jgi:hypothetical protein